MHVDFELADGGSEVDEKVVPVLMALLD